MSPTAPQPEPRRGLIRRTLRNWWLPILAIWVVGSAGLWAVIYKDHKPVYRASSILRVDPLPEDLFGVRRGGEQMDTFLATQVQLITSPSVLASAGAQPKARSLPRIQASGDVVLELKKVINVGVVRGTSLIEVSMVSESPHEAATLVNAVVDAFMVANNDWSKSNSASQVRTLEDYMADLKAKSDAVDREWRLLASRSEAQVFVKGEDRRSELTLEQYKWLQHDLFEANMELAIAQAWASEAKAAASNARKNPASPADEALLAEQVDRRFKQDPQVVELASQLTEARAKLDEIRKTVRPADDPAESEALKRLKTLQERYDQLWEVKHRQAREEILANKPNPDGEWLEAEARVRALGVRQKALKQQFDRLEVRKGRQPADEVDLAQIHEQRESLRVMKEVVNRRLEQLSFEARGEARIRVYNPATAPGAPISESPIRLIALTPIFMLPIAFAFFLGFEAFSGSTVPASTVPAKEEPPAEV